MRKTLSSVLVLALVLSLLTGCTMPGFLNRLLHRGETADTDGGMTVYRLSAAGADAGSDLLQPEQCALPEGSAADIASALTLFVSDPTDDSLKRALPDGTQLVRWSMTGGVVTVEFSVPFTDCSASQQTVTACALTLTLCQIETVKAVTVVSGGQTIFSGLVPEDVVTSGTETDPYVRQLRLFFVDSTGRRLVSEYHSLTLSEETSPERYVVEELLRGPNSSDLYSAIPAGTQLLSCRTEDHVCTVDLSEEFYTGRPATALGERLAVYSLVNSLTALADVDSVCILVEGEPVDTYTLRSLIEPLEWYEEAIDTGSSSAYAAEVQLYVAVPDLDALAEFPCRLSVSSGQTRAEALLEVLLAFKEPGYPALFSGSGLVNSVRVDGRACTVDLTESFFASLPEEARGIAVQSIAATLCALAEIDSVSFTAAGQSAVFDGTDYSGPWYDLSEIEVY